MGKGVHDKKSQLFYIKNRLKMFSEVIETMDAEVANGKEMDRIVAMLDDLRFKCVQFRKDWD